MHPQRHERSAGLARLEASKLDNILQKYGATSKLKGAHIDGRGQGMQRSVGVGRRKRLRGNAGQHAGGIPYQPDDGLPCGCIKHTGREAAAHRVLRPVIVSTVGRIACRLLERRDDVAVSVGQ